MKAADLSRAAQIAEARQQNAAIRARLASGEPLTLLLGDGSASAIVLSPGYEKRIRADLMAAFAERIADNDTALAAIGVELDG